MLPETQYARLGSLHLAYQVLGQGPPDILLLDQLFSHMAGSDTHLKLPTTERV
jgi:hypothetical protein